MVKSPTITVTANGNNGDNGNGVRFPLIQDIINRVRDRLDTFRSE